MPSSRCWTTSIGRCGKIGHAYLGLDRSLIPYAAMSCPRACRGRRRGLDQADLIPGINSIAKDEALVDERVYSNEGSK